MCVTLGTISTTQTKGTQATADAVNRLLNCCATHPDATIQNNCTSNMTLHIHSNALHLSELHACSQAGGHFFLSNQPDKSPTMLNDTIHAICSILRHVESSATEAELGALFIKCKEAAVLCQTSTHMGWQQPPTLVQTDNAVAKGIANSAICQQ